LRHPNEKKGVSSWHSQEGRLWPTTSPAAKKRNPCARAQEAATTAASATRLTEADTKKAITFSCYLFFVSLFLCDTWAAERPERCLRQVARAHFAAILVATAAMVRLFPAGPQEKKPSTQNLDDRPKGRPKNMSAVEKWLFF
jgi:hypothetical protein